MAPRRSITMLNRVATIALSLGVPAGLLAGDYFLRVANLASETRTAELVTLSGNRWSQIMAEVASPQIRVLAAGSETPLPSQSLDLNGDGKADELVFLADFAPGEQRTFVLKAGRPPVPAPRVFGRLVPERSDDFAWENDRVAYRVYGKRLENELVSSGIDVWCKRTPALIIDKWYRRGDYHKDHGEGLDAYNVGPSRGCGGTAILANGKLVASRNFVASRVLASGPLRLVFELDYAPWTVGSTEVRETKRITMDAGNHFFRVDDTFFTKAGGPDLPVAIGLQRPTAARQTTDANLGWMSVWGALSDKDAGRLGVGIIIGQGGAGGAVRNVDGHVVWILTTAPGKPVSYWVGSGWQKSGQGLDAFAWETMVDRTMRLLASPLKISGSNGS